MLTEILSCPQEETVETLDTDMDKELPKIIYQLENRRVRYLLKTYLRTRLKKIEKYAAHVLDATPEYRQRLSQRELVYCQDYFISVGRHLRETVLQHMPPNFKSLVRSSSPAA